MCLLVLNILLNLVNFGTCTTSKCDRLIQLLGGFEINEKEVRDIMTDSVIFLSTIMKNKKKSKNIMKRATIVLDWILGLALTKFVPKSSLENKNDNIEDWEVKEGCKFWYVADATHKNSQQVEARIISCHTDDVSGCGDPYKTAQATISCSR